jgi:hypothetical protein
MDIVQSAGYFTVATTNHSYGFITLSSGRTERRVLCRSHAYNQLQGLEATGQVDEFETMHIRTQIEDSGLPLVVPSEFEEHIKQLMTEDADIIRKVFAPDYFHPSVEDFLAGEVVDIPSRPVANTPSILQ